jgi:hypothetical protein
MDQGPEQQVRPEQEVRPEQQVRPEQKSQLRKQRRNVKPVSFACGLVVPLRAPENSQARLQTGRVVQVHAEADVRVIEARVARQVEAEAQVFLEAVVAPQVQAEVKVRVQDAQEALRQVLQLHPTSRAWLVPPRLQSGMMPPRLQSGMMPPRLQSGMMPPRLQSGMMPPRLQSGMMPPRLQADQQPEAEAGVEEPQEDVVEVRVARHVPHHVQQLHRGNVQLNWKGWIRWMIGYSLAKMLT